MGATVSPLSGCACVIGLEQFPVFCLGMATPERARVAQLVEAQTALASIGLRLDELDDLFASAANQLPVGIAVRLLLLGESFDAGSPAASGKGLARRHGCRPPPVRATVKDSRTIRVE
jgi:hypothetical protein